MLYEHVLHANGDDYDDGAHGANGYDAYSGKDSGAESTGDYDYDSDDKVRHDGNHSHTLKATTNKDEWIGRGYRRQRHEDMPESNLGSLERSAAVETHGTVQLSPSDSSGLESMLIPEEASYDGFRSPACHRFVTVALVASVTASSAMYFVALKRTGDSFSEYGAVVMFLMCLFDVLVMAIVVIYRTKVSKELTTDMHREVTKIRYIIVALFRGIGTALVISVLKGVSGTSLVVIIQAQLPIAFLFRRLLTPNEHSLRIMSMPIVGSLLAFTGAAIALVASSIPSTANDLSLVSTATGPGLSGWKFNAVLFAACIPLAIGDVFVGKFLTHSSIVQSIADGPLPHDLIRVWVVFFEMFVALIMMPVIWSIQQSYSVSQHTLALDLDRGFDCFVGSQYSDSNSECQYAWIALICTVALSLLKHLFMIVTKDVSGSDGAVRIGVILAAPLAFALFCVDASGITHDLHQQTHAQFPSLLLVIALAVVIIGQSMASVDVSRVISSTVQQSLNFAVKESDIRDSYLMNSVLTADYTGMYRYDDSGSDVGSAVSTGLSLGSSMDSPSTLRTGVN